MSTLSRPSPIRSDALRLGALAADRALHAAWQVRRGRPIAVGLLHVVGIACAALGAIPYVGAGRSPHALGYVLASTLILAGAGWRRS